MIRRVVALLALLGVLVALLLAWALMTYPGEYVYRVLAWRESDALDWQRFPSHRLEASPNPERLPQVPDPRVPELLRSAAATDDWERFLADSGTQAFVVVRDGAIAYEGYFNGTERDSIVTSFSVAKSFTTALIGIAIDQGYIGTVYEAVTDYLPELADRDSRFREITIRHLMTMASGLEYEAFRPLLFNGDDPLTTYHPNQRQLALENTHILEPPGRVFSYNKYHPQLLGMILERATGQSVTGYLQTNVWDPLGMEYGGSWSTDSLASGFEKMETGVNARAVDFAKFGQLYLNQGRWGDTRVISESWIRESTAPAASNVQPEAVTYPESFEARPGKAYYGYMWWGFERPDGSYDFTAAGDRAQYIYVSPSSRLVIVRCGLDYGIPHDRWLSIFYEVASALSDNP